MGRIGQPLRSQVMRAAIGSSELLDGVFVRRSKLGNPAIFDKHRLPWTALLEEHWREIRDEILAAIGDDRNLPPLRRISPDHDRVALDDLWRTFFLVGYGVRSERNAALCPLTSSLISRIVGLQTATVSVLEPGARIPPHVGATKAIITCHLALVVPRERERCRIIVGGESYAWREGEMFVFDDMVQHAVENATEDRRVILLLHIKRPLASWAAPLRDAWLWLIRISPFVQDAKRRIEAWPG